MRLYRNRVGYIPLTIEETKCILHVKEKLITCYYPGYRHGIYVLLQISWYKVWSTQIKVANADICQLAALVNGQTGRQTAVIFNPERKIFQAAEQVGQPGMS